MAKNVEQATVDYYNKNARQWFDDHSNKEGTSYWGTELNTFQTLLGDGMVLEIGSGVGIEATELRKRGYRYVGVDASKEFIQLAKERNPDGNFALMWADEIGFPENTFQGVFSAATLLHVPKCHVDKVLGNIVRVVKPGGIGFISVKEGQGEEQDKTGRWFFYYSEDEFKNIAERNGLKVIEFQRRQSTGKTIWLSFFVKVEK